MDEHTALSIVGEELHQSKYKNLKTWKSYRY